MKTSSGFSLTELLVATAASLVLFGASSHVFLSSISALQRTNEQSEVDSLYLVTTQGLRNVARLNTLLPVGVGSSLAICLGGHGTDCATLDAVAKAAAFADPDLNGVFGVSGRCASNQITETCNRRVVATYQWLCSDPVKCASLVGLKVFVSVQSFGRDGKLSLNVAERSGVFTIPAPAFTAKRANVRCPNVLPVRGFDYTTYTIECQYVAQDAPCLMPSKIYGEVITCQDPQGATDAGGGFQAIGLASGQNTPADPVASPLIPPLSVVGP